MRHHLTLFVSSGFVVKVVMDGLFNYLQKKIVVLSKVCWFHIKFCGRNFEM